MYNSRPIIIELKTMFFLEKNTHKTENQWEETIFFEHPVCDHFLGIFCLPKHKILQFQPYFPIHIFSFTILLLKLVKIAVFYRPDFRWDKKKGYF